MQIFVCHFVSSTSCSLSFLFHTPFPSPHHRSPTPVHVPDTSSSPHLSMNTPSFSTPVHVPITPSYHTCTRYHPPVFAPRHSFSKPVYVSVYSNRPTFPTPLPSPLHSRSHPHTPPRPVIVSYFLPTKPGMYPSLQCVEGCI